MLTRKKLAKILRAMRGATMATIEAETVPQLLKRHRETGEPLPYETVVKVSRVNVTLNPHYANSVNRQRLREDKPTDFEPVPRKWGERVKVEGRLTPLVEHKEKLYIEVKVNESLESNYYADGKEISADSLAGYIRESSSRQGVDREVILRDYALDNLRAIALHGNYHTLHDGADDDD